MDYQPHIPAYRVHLVLGIGQDRFSPDHCIPISSLLPPPEYLCVRVGCWIPGAGTLWWGWWPRGPHISSLSHCREQFQLKDLDRYNIPFISYRWGVRLVDAIAFSSVKGTCEWTHLDNDIDSRFHYVMSPCRSNESGPGRSVYRIPRWSEASNQIQSFLEVQERDSWWLLRKQIRGDFFMLGCLTLTPPQTPLPIIICYCKHENIKKKRAYDENPL